jgi:mono/diheme cytochrome c family protein
MRSQSANRTSLILLAALSAVATACARPSPGGAASAIDRGRELVSVGGCADCHTPKTFDPAAGMPVPDETRRLSGHPTDAPDPQASPGKADTAVIGPTFTSFRVPFGVVYAANLTPDAETGLGAWTEADFIATMRTGHHKGTGRVLLPPMPWQNLASMSDADLRAAFAYLRTLPAVRNAVPRPAVPTEAIDAIDRGVARLSAPRPGVKSL